MPKPNRNGNSIINNMKKLILSLTVSTLACACSLQAADAAKPKAAEKSKDKAACTAKADASCCQTSCCKSASKQALPPRAMALFAKPSNGG